MSGTRPRQLVVTGTEEELLALRKYCQIAAQERTEINGISLCEIFNQMRNSLHEHEHGNI